LTSFREPDTFEAVNCLILYATREGHTRRIAEHLAATIRARGHMADTVDAAHLPPEFSLASYQAAIVAASVHVGRHEPEIVSFVKRHKAGLEQIPAVFLSVSLTETTAEDPHAPPEARARAAADVDRMIRSFLEETGWRPDKVRPVAGALMYSKYNFLVRFIMRRIAARAGGDTDTSRDHVYTDWEALDRIAADLLGEA
jgi:menaquinone-dependent protoporphyrinogen oxidase